MIFRTEYLNHELISIIRNQHSKSLSLKVQSSKQAATYRHYLPTISPPSSVRGTVQLYRQPLYYSYAEYIRVRSTYVYILRTYSVLRTHRLHHRPIPANPPATSKRPSLPRHQTSRKPPQIRLPNILRRYRV